MGEIDSFDLHERLEEAWPDPRDQRLADLEAALRALTAVDPVARSEWRASESGCHYCESAEWADFANWEDCPWVRAKALLGGSG